MKKIHIFLVLFACILAACTKDDAEQMNSEKAKSHINMKVHDFIMNNENFVGTRTSHSIDFSAGTFKTIWLPTSDFIEVYAIEEEGKFDAISHVPFEITSYTGDNDKSWSYFTGSGFGLVNGYKYGAIYPRTEKQNDPTNITVDFSEILEGITIKPNDLSHLSKLDYLYTKEAAIPDGNKCTLDFYHMSAIVAVRMIAMNDITFDQINFHKDEDTKITSAKRAGAIYNGYNVNLGTGTLTATKTKDLNFKVEETSLKRGEIVTFYLVIPTNNAGTDGKYYWSGRLGFKLSYNGTEMSAWNTQTTQKDYYAGNVYSEVYVLN